MRVINFLPDDYLQRRSLRRANWLCLAVAGGALLVLGLVVGFVFVGSLGIAGMRVVVELQYEEASRQIEDLEDLEERKSGLLHKVELSTVLLERVPRSHVLARLTNHLPENTSLTTITMQAENVTVTPEDKAGNKAAAASKRTGKDKDKKVKITRVRFRLDGLARTDVEVAEFMSRLHADPLFENVDLQFSEEFPYQEGVTMRRFQLAFLLSRQAAKALETSMAEEPAGSDPAIANAKGHS